MGTSCALQFGTGYAALISEMQLSFDRQETFMLVQEAFNVGLYRFLTVWRPFPGETIAGRNFGRPCLIWQWLQALSRRSMRVDVNLSSPSIFSLYKIHDLVRKALQRE
jgi:hypothetical protein